MNFGSSFSRNQGVDPFGGNWVRNERIIIIPDVDDSSHPSNSSGSTPSKVTLPQFFAKSDVVPSKDPKKNDAIKPSPTMITDEDKPARSRPDKVSSSRRLDPPGALAEEKVKKHRKVPKRNKSKSSSEKDSSERKHKDERRKQKERRRKKLSEVEQCCDETIVSWTRTPETFTSRLLVAKKFHQSQQLSNDGQLLRLKASKSKRNLHHSFDVSLLDMTSTTTKTTNSGIGGEITELVRKIQANPKSPNPRRIRNDRRSMQPHKRVTRGLERKTSAARLTMVASPPKIRRGIASSRKNSLTGTSPVQSDEQPKESIYDNPGKQEQVVVRRNSVAPLDFSEFENEDFSAGDGADIIDVVAAD